MKRPRFRRLWLIPLGLLALPPLGWGLVLMLARTDCARDKIVAQLSAATGRTVRLQALKIGLFGGVSLTELEIAAPGSSADPWLKLAAARIDVNMFQLLTGHVEPTEVEVEGLTLRVLRHKDGTLELSDLLQAAPAKASSSSSGGSEPAGLEVLLKNATITVIDEPSQTRLVFTGVEGRATWAGPRATIHKIQGTLNGGPFELTAQLDRSAAAPAFEGQIRAHDVALSEGMGALNYVVPVLAGAPASLDGKLAVDVYVRGQGDTREALQKSLVGQGSIHLDPIDLDGSKFVATLSRVVELPPRGRVGSVGTDFAVKAGRITTDDFALNLAKVPIVLSGWTDFDGKLNYRLKTEGLTEKLPGKARNLLSELEINLNDLAALKVQGSVDDLIVTLDGRPLNESKAGSHPGVPKLDDRQRMKEIGQRLKEKFLR